MRTGTDFYRTSRVARLGDRDALPVGAGFDCVAPQGSSNRHIGKVAGVGWQWVRAIVCESLSAGKSAFPRRRICCAWGTRHVAHDSRRERCRPHRRFAARRGWRSPLRRLSRARWPQGRRPVASRHVGTFWSALARCLSRARSRGDAQCVAPIRRAQAYVRQALRCTCHPKRLPRHSRIHARFPKGTHSAISMSHVRLR